MRDLLVSVVRTIVPVVVGLIISTLATAGIEIDENSLRVVVDGLFVGGYYALVRVLEKQHPAIGWLLGLPAAPSYDATSDT